MEIQSKRLIRDPGMKAEPVQAGEAVVVEDAPVVETRRYVSPTPVAVVHRYGLMDRVFSIIWLAVGLVSGVILLRFLLLMFAADMATPFASAISQLSQPMVEPFLGLFGPSVPYGAGAIEYTDLIAVIFYTICAAVLVRLLNLLLGRREVVYG